MTVSSKFGFTAADANVVMFNDDLYPTIWFLNKVSVYLGVIFGFERTEYSITENQGVLEVSVLKLTETSQTAIVRFSTSDILVGKSHSNSCILNHDQC